MDYDEGKVLLGNAIRPFVRKGGKLRYQPFVAKDGRIHWQVFGIQPNGHELPVYVVRTGEARVLKTIGAVLNYHQEYFPLATELCVGILPLEEGQTSGGDEEAECTNGGEGGGVQGTSVEVIC